MTISRLLDRTAAHAAGYIDTVNARPIAATASIEELRARLAKPLPEASTDAVQVIDELVRDTEGGILGSSNGRFFGWVIGGTLRRRWPRIGSPPPRTRTPPPT